MRRPEGVLLLVLPGEVLLQLAAVESQRCAVVDQLGELELLLG